MLLCISDTLLPNFDIICDVLGNREDICQLNEFVSNASSNDHYRVFSLKVEMVSHGKLALYESFNPK